MNKFPVYKCHKLVRAFKIETIIKYSIYPEGHNIPVVMDYEFKGKHNPQEGGYIIYYNDGYVSYSPKEAFEEGYTLLKE